MGVKKPTFATLRAVAIIEQIAAFMSKNGSATLPELAAITGKHRNTIGEYLNHMRRQGSAHCVTPSASYQGGTTQARWANGKGDGCKSIPLGGVRRHVVIRKEWEPNHRRNTLDCYLFGVPAAMQTA